MKNIFFFFFLILFCIPFKESNQDPTTKEGFIKRYLLYLSKYSGSGGGPIFTPAIGELDTTFGGTGKVTTAISSDKDYGYAIAIQSDGKTVVAGYSYNSTTNNDIAVVRYNTDGSLDTSFDGDGIVKTDISSGNDTGYGIAIQNDGKIIVAGSGFISSSIDFAVVRYNTDGSLDTSFDGDGIVTTDIGSSTDYGYAIAIQSDDKIVVVGYSNYGGNFDFAVVRYNTDGILDISFDGDGKVTTPVGSNNDYGRAVAIQNDGKIIVAGFSYNGTYNDIAVVRYNTDGTLDTTTFGCDPTCDGIVTTDIGTGNDNGQAIAIQSDGKIVVVGYTGTSPNIDIAVVRYNTDGILDISFDGDGKVTTPVGSSDDYGYAIGIQPDGNIVVVGSSWNGTNYDIFLVRYNTDGSLDISFDGDGKVTTPVGSSDDQGQAVAIQSDGKIVVAGYTGTSPNFDIAVVRYK